MKCAACEFTGDNFEVITSFVPELQKNYSIAFCPQCGLGQTLEVVEEDVQKINELRYGDTEGRVKVYYSQLFHHLQVRYLESLRILKRYTQGNRLLEVGSNIGFTLSVARRQGYEVTGCEINEHGRKVSEALHDIKIENDFFRISQLFDVIIMNDVLEHFPDPALAFKQAHHLLSEGGVLFIQLPNIGSNRFRRLQTKWEFLMPPDHTYHFTIRSLRLMAEKNQLNYVWHRTVNSIEDFRIFDWLPLGWGDKMLYMLHHNPWYWPKFYERKDDSGSLIQMIVKK